MNDLKKKSFDLDNLDGNVDVFNKAQWYRLMKWREVVESSGNRNLDYAVDLIGRVCSALDLDDSVRDVCVDVYDDCLVKGVLTGRSIEGLVPAAVFVGLRMLGVARTSAEVSEAGKVTDKELLRTVRVVCKELDIRLPLLSPKDFVPRFGESLGVSEDVLSRCYDLLDDCEVAGLCNGPSPTSLCGVCLYIACLECGERRTQRDIGEICGVTEVTIRNNLRKVKSTLNLP